MHFVRNQSVINTCQSRHSSPTDIHFIILSTKTKILNTTYTIPCLIVQSHRVLFFPHFLYSSLRPFGISTYVLPFYFYLLFYFKCTYHESWAEMILIYPSDLSSGSAWAKSDFPDLYSHKFLSDYNDHLLTICLPFGHDEVYEAVGCNKEAPGELTAKMQASK